MYCTVKPGSLGLLNLGKSSLKQNCPRLCVQKDCKLITVIFKNCILVNKHYQCCGSRNLTLVITWPISVTAIL